MATLILHAPLSGWCAPLGEVPDPVFAACMLGDGLAIDPSTSLVIAPCAAEVTSVPAGAHAVSLRTADGVDVLIHVGIDTVQLQGRGFEPLVQQGQSVRLGQPLLRFDLDLVARTARSLMTPIVVTAAPGLQISKRHAAGAVREGEVLLEIDVADIPARKTPPPHTVGSTAVRSAPTPELSRTLVVPLRHGFHARPAALLAQRLGKLDAHVTLSANGRSASASSVVALMALGARYGEQVSILATGADAAASLDVLEAALAEAARAEPSEPAEPSQPTTLLTRPTALPTHPADASHPPKPQGAAPSDSRRDDAHARTLDGVIAVKGFAVGRAVRYERRSLAVAEAGRGIALESAELERARATVRARLTRLAQVGGAARREIVAAHIAFLDDPLLNEVAHERIASGKSAGFAWRAAVRRSITALEALADARLRERADDLADIESHVLLALGGEALPARLSLPADAVLVADELLPSELVALERQSLQAICLSGGGPTSHVAILAAAMDVPMLVGLGATARHIETGTPLIVDAERGRVEIAPPDAELAAAANRASEERAAHARARSAAQRDAYTRDSTRIEVYANLGSGADAEAAVAAGAEGCGLLRTEFLFLERETAPLEAEQLAAYQQVANALAGRPLVLRLLDVGGDKPLKYLPLPAEPNPALGLRGIRAALAHPDLLRTQLRAALRVEPPGIVRLLVPMVSDVKEIEAVRSLIAELGGELGLPTPPELGAMIETPSAALKAEHLASVVDFFSIGSNDLTQYTLAIDREHPELAPRVDALDPAVLKLIAMTAAAGAHAGKLVAVCGGVAADPAAVPLLLGFGVRELSVVPAAVPSLKRQIRMLGLEECAALAAHSLKLASAAEVRARITESLRASGGVE